MDPPDGGSVTLAEQVSRMKAERDQLREQVAVLREAFQTFIDEHEECSDADDWLAMMCSCEAYHVANEALAASEPKITKPT